MQGISFKKGDHSFKGSDIDRKYSYFRLDAVLNDNIQNHGQQQIIIPKETNSNPLENMVSGAADIISGIGGLFDVQPSNSDADEAEYLRQQALNKKKKPQMRRAFRKSNE
ncbi:hypothetical protein [Dysgonomonas sp.]